MLLIYNLVIKKTLILLFIIFLTFFPIITIIEHIYNCVATKYYNHDLKRSNNL